jgi:ATP-dependent Lhr-like helicase
MRFLFAWQHVDASTRLTGLDGVRVVIEQLDGFELAADAWDRRILPARVKDYDPSMLDLLCFSGEAAWARLSKPPAVNPSAILPPRPVRATPIALFRRDHARAWRALAGSDRPDAFISDTGRDVLRVLTEKGARFVHEIAAALDAAIDVVRDALAELVWAGLVASDGFAGLRAIWNESPAMPSRLFRGRSMASTASPGGRWSMLADEPEDDRATAVEAYAHALLRRYGIMCRRLMSREPHSVPWRELLQVYRRLEARGDVRGGRFVSGLPGEQFALPEAVELARAIRRSKSGGETMAISAADPLNLCGIITPGEKIPAVASTQITFRDGIAQPIEAGNSQLTVAS